MTDRYRAFLAFFLVIALLVHVPLAVSAQAPHNLRGDVVGDIPVEGTWGDTCNDPSSLLVPGNMVQLKAADGSILGQGELAEGIVNGDEVCAYEFVFLDIPEMDEYFLDVELGGVGSMEPQRLPLDMLIEANWRVKTTIRTAAYLEATGGNPAPTAAPRPTATTPAAPTVVTSTGQSGNLTTDEALYLGQMRAWTNMATASLDNITALSGSPRFGVPEWEHDIVAETGIWSAIYDQVRQTIPPARFANVHDRLETAYESLNQSGFHLRRGIETYDVSEIELATQYIRDFTAEIEEATEDVDGLMPGMP